MSSVPMYVNFHLSLRIENGSTSIERIEGLGATLELRNKVNKVYI